MDQNKFTVKNLHNKLMTKLTDLEKQEKRDCDERT